MPPVPGAEARVERQTGGPLALLRGRAASVSFVDGAGSAVASRAPREPGPHLIVPLLELGADQNSTVVFPLPMDLVGPLMERFSGLPHPGSSDSPARGADGRPSAPTAAGDGGVDEGDVEPAGGGADSGPEE